jgi:hypothetical protein
MFDFLRNLTKSAQEKRQEALNAYLDDALTPRQRQHFEEQLAQEPELRAELAQLRLIKRQLHQLPTRPVPRNFTLDPARYGRPQRQPLLQLYPALRVATALTAFFFILAVAAEVVTSGAGVPAIADMAPMAEQVEVTRMVQVEVAEEGEVVEITRVVTEEVLVEEEAVEEAAEAEEETMAEEPAVQAPTEEPAAEMAQEGPTAEATATMTGETALTAEAAADTALTATPTSTPSPAGTTAVATTTARTVPPTATVSEIPRPSPPAVDDDRALTIVISPEVGDQEVGTAVLAQDGTDRTERQEDGRRRLPPLSSLRLLQIGLGTLFVILVVVTVVARRRF